RSIVYPPLRKGGEDNPIFRAVDFAVESRQHWHWHATYRSCSRLCHRLVFCRIFQRAKEKPPRPFVRVRLSDGRVGLLYSLRSRFGNLATFAAIRLASSPEGWNKARAAAFSARPRRVTIGG